MCCSNRYTYGDNPQKHGVCPECDEAIDEDGLALDICSYSPVICETCGNAPCDDSC